MQARTTQNTLYTSGILNTTSPLHYSSLLAQLEVGYEKGKKILFKEAVILNKPTTLNAMLHVRYQAGRLYPWHVDVCDPSPLGAGGFGTTYKILGKIKFNDSSHQYIPTSKYILKIKHEQEDRYDVLHERLILEKLPHLHSKHLSFNPETGGTILRLRYFQGGTLHARIYKPLPSPLTQLYVCLQSLYALKSEFHDRKIIHKDIKPSNMIVNITPDDMPSVHFIDTDLCSLATEETTHFEGTYRYRAPECYNLESTTLLQDEKSDHYSLALSLFEWMSKKEFIIQGSPSCAIPSEKKNTLGHHLACEQCFDKKQLTDLLTNAFQYIKNTFGNGEVCVYLVEYFKQALLSDHSDRPSVDDGIGLFQEIIKFCELNEMNSEHRSNFHTSFIIAKQTRLKLREITDINNACTLIETYLKPIADHPVIVRKFAYTLNLRFLFECNKKEDILHTLQNIQSGIQTLNDLWYEELTLKNPSLQLLIRKIKRKQNSYTPVDLNGLQLDHHYNLLIACEPHYQTLLNQTPSLFYKLYLESRFGFNAWQRPDQKTKKRICEWMANEEESNDSQRAFFLHYQLLSLLLRMNTSDKLIQAIANIDVSSVTSLREGIIQLQRSLPISYENKSTLFQGLVLQRCVNQVFSFLSPPLAAPATYKAGNNLIR